MRLNLLSRISNILKNIDTNIKLVLDYENVDPKDTYCFYLTNLTLKSKTKQLPMIGSFEDKYPDYWALESEPGMYHKTNNTGVCWFKEENYIDKIYGLYPAIQYKEIDLIKYYKTRYLGVKYFIPVDYSLCGDYDEETLVHNLKRQCVTYLWQVFEMNAISYPLMTYGDESSLSWCFEHIMVGSNVAVSLKMVMTGPEKDLFKKALMVLVDTIKPKALVVYTVAKKESTLEMLQYAIEHNIRIVEVANTLMLKNRGVRNG